MFVAVVVVVKYSGSTLAVPGKNRTQTIPVFISMVGGAVDGW